MTHICSFSESDDYFIIVAGKKWRFDFSDRFGPTPVTKAGRELTGHIPGNFYEAVSWWYRQGKKVVDGLCVWDIPKEQFVMLNNRNYVTREIARKLGMTEKDIVARTITMESKL